MQQKPSSQTIAHLPDQSRGRMLPGGWRAVVRVAAVVGFLLFIILSQHDSSPGSVLNHLPAWLRWSLLFFIGWYGWWETSLQMKKSHQQAWAQKRLSPVPEPGSAENLKRISLLVQTPEHLRALLEGADTYQRRFHVAVADGVRDFLAGPEVSAEFLERLNGSAPADPWRDGFAVLHKADNTIIGLCGFTGPPSVDGAVEIAYGIAPGYQNRGHAREAAQELIAYAFASGQVRTVRAHTLPQNNASTRILTKFGFTLVGEVAHSDDGVVWCWEMQRKVA